MRYKIRLSLLCSAALLGAGQAHAANTSGLDSTGDVQEHTEAPSPDEIIVFGRASRDTSLSIPQTVTVLDASVIEQTGSETVGDALRFIPGAQRDGSPLDTFGDTFLVRGFEANQTLNGMYANALRQARDSVGIERIEVLKGPASVLYGQLQPGAVVNIVTKQPRREFAGAASLSYGRFNDFRGTLDLTGPLATNGDVRFRLTGAYDDSDAFVDFWHRKHLFIAPVLAFDIGDATTVTLEGFYSRNRLDGFFNGLPAAGTVLPNPNGKFTRSLSLTDPTLPASIREDSNVSLRIEHNFSDAIRWRAAVDWTREERDEASVLGVFGWDEEFRSLTRILLSGEGGTNSGDTWTVHNDLALDFATGGIDHSLVLGGDYTWFDRQGYRKVFFLPSLDLFNPVYSIDTPPAMTELANQERETEEHARTAGLFIQDRITLTDKLNLIGGLRWSHFKETARSVFPNRPSESTDRQSHTAWTSQLGLLYTPVEGVALFASRTTSFLPTFGIAADGTALEPETGTQYEAGVKAQIAQGRIGLGASFFHLTRGNVVVADRDNPGFEISIGEQVAKGVELTADAQPVDGLSLHAGYAYTDAKTIRDTDETLEGLRIRNVPRHSLVLRGAYAWEDGALSGLQIGGSATYTSKRAGDLDNTFDLPSYWRLDASIGYALSGNIELGGSIENLTGERYYDYAFSEFEVWPGAPRTWKVFVRSRF